MSDAKQVLVVDDSSTSRMIIQRCLEVASLGFDTFVQAENGMEALAILREHEPFDLILTDINMPKMDGQTFVKLVKSKPETRDIPLVVISSIADGAFIDELLRLGVDSVIKKPVSPAKILEALGGKHE
jgi:two-component system chemotaxis response regulator CheY